MKNVKRINESQLRAIVAESVKRTLREMKEGTITIGSPEDGDGYHVTIALDSLGPYAEFDVYGVGSDGQAAIDAAVDYLDKQGETGYFWDDEEQAQEYPDDFITGGNYCHQLRSDLVDIEPIRGINEFSAKKALKENYTLSSFKGYAKDENNFLYDINELINLYKTFADRLEKVKKMQGGTTGGWCNVVNMQQYRLEKFFSEHPELLNNED